MTGIVKCELESETGDIDMLMALDNPATNPDLLDCASYQYDSDEVCSVVVMNNDAGTRGEEAYVCC